MAEILGVVASGITVVGVAGKVGDRFIALKRLLNEIHNVPEVIASLMRDIEILEPLLTEMEKDFDDTIATGTASSTARTALSYCRKAMVDLDTMLEDLSVNLKSSRKLRRGKAKMKVVLGKDILDRCKDRLYTAMRFLDVARGLFLPELVVRRIRLENTIIQCQLEMPGLEPTEQEEQTTANIVHLQSITRTTVARSKTTNSACWGFGAFGKLTWKYTQYNTEFNETNFNLNARLQFFQAFVRKAWDIQVSKATSGWNFNFKPYNIVSEDSLVIKYANEGNINGIRELFNNKQASIYDYDTYDRSLLRLAALEGKVKLMKFLITWGLDINEEAGFVFQTPFHCLISSMRYLPDFKSVLDFLILNNAFDSDGSFFASMVRDRPFFTHFGRFAISSPEIFKELQPLLWPRYYELTIIDRLKYFGFEHCGHFKRSPPKAQTLCYILREDGVIQEKDVIELQQQGINILNLAVYCRSCCKSYSDGDRYGWEELCRKLIPMTTDLSYNQASMQLLPQDSIELPSGTPLFLAISGKGWPYLCVARLTWSIRKYVKAWLEDLHACGVDLQKYGYTEKNRFSANGWFGNTWFGNRLFITRGLGKTWYGAFQGAYDWDKYGDVKVKLINFDVGSRPEDWVFHWDMDAERYAGQFWDLIENPPSRVPGSWVDDDESFYYSSIDEYDSDDELESE